MHVWCCISVLFSFWCNFMHIRNFIVVICMKMLCITMLCIFLLYILMISMVLLCRIMSFLLMHGRLMWTIVTLCIVTLCFMMWSIEFYIIIMTILIIICQILCRMNNVWMPEESLNVMFFTQQCMKEAQHSFNPMHKAVKISHFCHIM